MEKVTYEYLTLAELSKKIDKDELIAFDVETDGFYGTIHLAQFKQLSWDKTVLVKNPDIQSLSRLMKSVTFVAHNAGYEVSTIQTQLRADLCVHDARLWQPSASSWEDTLLTCKLFYYTKEKFSLDDCYTYFLGYDPYEAEGLDKKLFQKYDWSQEVLAEEAELYAATDVHYLLELFNKTKEAAPQAYKLLKFGTDVCFSLQQNGLAVDPARLEKLMIITELKLEILDLPINPNSWQQVRQYLGVDKSDGLFLKTQALSGLEGAADVVAARSLSKLLSFLTKFKDTMVNGRVHGRFNFTTATGRSKCAQQNLQQIPRASKGCFAVKEGRKLVISDYSQLELRYVCVASKDRIMYDAFQSGIDLHQYTADVMGTDRAKAKTCNFNLVYGGSANALRNILIGSGVLLTLKEVQKLKERWLKTYPELALWQTRIVNSWRAKKYNEQTNLGRKFSCKLYTDALNYPVQGGASDIFKLALHNVNKALNAELEKEPSFVYSNTIICNIVHDSIVIETDDNPTVYKLVAKLLAKEMQKSWFDLIKGYSFEDLKMPVDVLVGDSWGELDYGTEEPIFKFELEGSDYYNKKEK